VGKYHIKLYRTLIMNLKLHTPQDHISISPKLPVINVNPETGRISFSVSLAKAIDLKADQKVVFIQDQDSPRDWYLAKVKDGFSIRLNGAVLAVINKSLAREMLKSLEVEGTAKIPVAIQHQDVNGLRLFALLTKGVEAMKVRKPHRNRFASET